MQYNINKKLPYRKGTIDPRTNFLLKRAKAIHSESNDTHSSTFYLLHNSVVAVHRQYKADDVSDNLVAATLQELHLLRLKKIML